MDLAVTAVAENLGFEMKPVFADENAPACYWQKMEKRDMKFSKETLDDDNWEAIWDEYGEEIEELQEGEQWKEWMKQLHETALNPVSLHADCCSCCGKNDPVYFHGEEKAGESMVVQGQLKFFPKYPAPSKKDDNYWIMWVENMPDPVQYCNSCHKKMVHAIGVVNGFSWAWKVFHHHDGHSQFHDGHNHDSSDLHDQWSQFHKYIQDSFGEKVGDVVDENIATAVVHHCHHCCWG